MASGQLNNVLQHLCRAALLQGGAGLLDGNLLERFIIRRDEIAFEALLRRHGPMVLGVCRRVLQNEADAEDAFQATFLALVCKAASIQPRSLVGNWLYGVAYNTAVRARAANTKRRLKEREVAAMPRPESSEEDGQELQALLDQELQGLPDKYRVPIVLCDLEGKTRKEAACHLGWPEGTVASRLTRARVLLARRVARRGLLLSGGALAMALSQGAASASVPLPLMMSTVKAVSTVTSGGLTASVISTKVAALTEGVLKAMLLTRLKTTIVAFLATVVLSVGVGILTWQPSAAAPPRIANQEAPPALTANQEALPDKNDDDKEAVRKVLAAGVDALNNRDPKALGEAFHPDAEFTYLAAKAHGRAGIVFAHHRFFDKSDPKPDTASYKSAKVALGEPRIRFLRPDVATVDVPWTITGVIGADGKDKEAQNGQALLVLTKEQGVWKVAEYHLADQPAPPAKKP